jgi:lysyl-tRNA synthetase class 2
MLRMKKENLILRSEIVKMIRRFFDSRGYTEMHTPRLVGLPGQEPHLEPFWTSVVDSRSSTVGRRQSGVESYPVALITSPEYAMKRLLASGFDKIYDLGPCFRNNEPWDGTHDPEFLMLEWYRKGGDLASLMDETEELVRGVGRGAWGVGKFRRITCEEAWKEYAGVELAPLIGDREAMARVAREKGQTVGESDTWDDLYFKVFLSEIEPKLSDEPTFLHRYPASQAALAKVCADDPRFADRVELYIGGLELANGFVELADANEQRKRFLEEQKLRAALGKKTWPADEKFLADLPNMGEAVGIAFGVDRLVMLMTGSTSINEVIPFSASERFLP